MRSVTSYFNRTLFAKNLSRFWPLWAIYSAIWLVMLPLMQFVQLHGYYAAELTVRDCVGDILSSGATGGLILSVAMGVLLAMALFSYLCTARSAGFFHSLPVSRETLFLTNYLSGIFMLTATHLTVFALSACVFLAAPFPVPWAALGTWLLLQVCLSFIFFSFAVFCAMFTGQVLAIPVFYGILNVLAVGVETLVSSFAGMFLYGSTGGGSMDFSEKFSPVIYLMDHLHIVYSDPTAVDGVRLADELLPPPTLNGIPALLIYTGVAFVFLLLAFWVYRGHRSETAGDTVSVAWAKPIFKYGLALCSALSLGQGLYMIVLGEFIPSDSGAAGLLGVVVCMILTGLAGFYAAEMLLRKSFRVFRETRRGALLLVAALALFGILMSVDVTGFERRIPAVEQLQSAELYVTGNTSFSCTIDDPEDLALLRDVHQVIVAHKATNNLPAEGEEVSDLYFSMRYFLKNGNSINRSYYLTLSPEDLEDESSVATAVEALLQRPSVQRQGLLSNQAIRTEDLRISGGELTCYTASDQYTTAIGTVEAQSIYAALLRDIENGSYAIGIFGDYEELVYSNNLRLFYTMERSGESWMSTLDPVLTTSCSETIAALQACGIVDEKHPLYTESELQEIREMDAKRVQSALPLDAAAMTGTQVLERVA